MKNYRSMNSAPLVSICIPSYNNEKYIKDAILSVYNQCYQNIELIICDDASSDGTNIVIESMIKNKPDNITIKYNKSEKNQGLAANWNRVISYATGKYIKILPGDDLLLPSCIDKQASALENNKNLALVYCARTIITRSGRELLKTGAKSTGVKAADYLVRKCVTNGTNVIGEPAAVLFPREVMNVVGEFDDTLPYVVDLNYWCRLLKHGNAFSIAEPLCVFRIDNNLSVRLGNTRVRNYLDFINIVSISWPQPNTIKLIGKLRAGLNEILRRGFHFYCQIKG